MSTEPQRELASTYFVQDKSNQEEMKRLEIQDTMLTTGMGGVLPELADPSQLRRVLDVGCGTGGWLLETARQYPAIEKLVGADISNKIIVHAREKAKAEGLDERVEFQVMDALRILEFPPASFDLVNQRLGVSWLRTWDWKKLLLEYQRVTRPRGIIRITEGIGAETNSPALTTLNNLVLETFYRSGHLFTPSSEGITGQLVQLLTQHEIQDVKSRVHTLVYRSGTAEHQHFYEDMQHGFRVALSFFQRWTRVPDDYEEICQQAKQEMQQPGFVATVTLLTVWGTRSDRGVPYMRELH
jgi:ubiquinone/menaquinone biosynthesis C-methylase UbiE